MHVLECMYICMLQQSYSPHTACCSVTTLPATTAEATPIPTTATEETANNTTTALASSSSSSSSYCSFVFYPAPTHSPASMLNCLSICFCLLSVCLCLVSHQRLCCQLAMPGSSPTVRCRSSRCLQSFRIFLLVFHCSYCFALLCSKLTCCSRYCCCCCRIYRCLFDVRLPDC